jgi:hypothetical protein
MSTLPRIWIALALAFLLALGQQAVLLHDLRHATEQIGENDPGIPVHSSCDQHFACAQLSGAAGSPSAAVLPVLQSGTTAAIVAPAFVFSLTSFPFRSRAPPVSPA